MSRRGPWDSLSEIVSDITDLENKNVKAIFFEQIDSGESGTITPPTGATIDLDEFGGGADALVSEMSGGFPTYDIASEADLTPITATLDLAGDWALSGTPSSYPVAIIYAYTIAFTNFDDSNSIIAAELGGPALFHISDVPTGVSIGDGTADGTQIVYAGIDVSILNTDPGGDVHIRGTVAGPSERTMAIFTPDGAQLLFFNDTAEFSTTLNGIRIGSILAADFFEIVHTGNDANFINRGHGDATYFKGENNSGAEKTMIKYDPDGATELYHAGLLKLSTSAQYLGGWEDADSVALSSDAGTPPTYTLTFTGTVYWWSDGIRYSDSGTDTIQIADTSGTHLIYYDGDTLTSALNPSEADVDDVIENKCLVMWVYWNTVEDEEYVIGNELHGIRMSGATHHWIHDNIGARWKSGGVLTGPDLDTPTDAALGFEITNLEFYDEDLEIDIIDGTAANQYEQQLSTGDAVVPVLYRDSGNGGIWKENTPSTLPYLYSSGVLNFMDADNSYALTEIQNNYYMNYWLVATNDWQYPIKMIPGTANYSTQQLAQGGAEEEVLDFGDLPAAEMVILYRFLMHDKNGGTTDAEVIEVIDYRSQSLKGVAAGSATAHGSLSGLSNDDHTQYILATGSRAGASSGSQTFTNGITVDGMVLSADNIVNDAGLTIKATLNTLILGDADPGGFNTYSQWDPDGTAYFKAGAASSNIGILCGINDVQYAAMYLYGGATVGAKFRMYVDAANDGNGTDYFLFDVVADDILIGPNNDPDAFKIIGGASVTAAFNVDLNINQNLIMADAKKQQWDSLPASDDTCSGDISSETVDTNAVGIGAILVLAADGNWDEADADAEATCGLLGMAVEAGTGAKLVMHDGWIHLAGHGFTVGRKLFVSTTQGLMTNTAPAGNGNVVQVVGYATDANTIRFNPSPDYLVVTA